MVAKHQPPKTDILWEGKTPSGTIGDPPGMLDLFRVLLPALAALFHERTTSWSRTYSCATLPAPSRAPLSPAAAPQAPRIDSSGWSFDGSTRPGGGISCQLWLGGRE
jgi:hypothetical protein